MIRKDLKIELIDRSTEMLSKIDSKGAQPKWRFKSINRETCYVKSDLHGYESLSEWTVYKILSECSNIRKDLIVPYYLCTIKGDNGCYSMDFKLGLEDEIPMQGIFDYLAVNFKKSYDGRSHSEKFEFIRSSMEQYTGMDFGNDLKLMFALDSFFLNEDRHAYNFSVLEDENMNYRMAPFFDSVMSFLSRTNEYPLETPTKVLMKKAKPYLLNQKFKDHIKFYDGPPVIYKRKSVKFMEEYKNELGRIYSILLIQLNDPEYKKLFTAENEQLNKSSIFS